ncbi:MAG: phosphocarrier protein NPr [Alteromonadaceae bacterium]|jgi:phosphocarrier protein NPr
MPSFTKELLIQNKLGLHTRAATKLVQLAHRFDAKILIRQADKEASADNVMALLMLESSMGKHITVLTEGADAETALLAVEELINKKFDEGG